MAQIKEAEAQKKRYEGRGATRSEEDVPHDRHWKRAKPFEKVDYDDKPKIYSKPKSEEKEKDKKAPEFKDKS